MAITNWAKRNRTMLLRVMSALVLLSLALYAFYTYRIPPELSPPAIEPTYCELLQPHLDAASTAAGITGLRCLDNPAMESLGYLGPPGRPTTRRLSTCLDPRNPHNVWEIGETNLNLGFYRDMQANLDASGKLRLDRLAPTLPAVAAHTQSEQRIRVRMMFEDVRKVVITDLAYALAAHRPATDRCTRRVCQASPDWRFTYIALQGTVVVDIMTGDRNMLDVKTEHAPETIALTAARKDTSHFVLRSLKPVIFAAAFDNATQLFKDAGMCDLCGGAGEPPFEGTCCATTNTTSVVLQNIEGLCREVRTFTARAEISTYPCTASCSGRDAYDALECPQDYSMFVGANEPQKTAGAGGRCSLSLKKRQLKAHTDGGAPFSGDRRVTCTTTYQCAKR